MVARDRLVMKVPAARIDVLVASGVGQPCDAGKGRPMREWISLEPGASLDVLALAREAFEFSASRSQPTR